MEANRAVPVAYRSARARHDLLREARPETMCDSDTPRPGSTGNVIAALCSLFVPGLGQLVQGRFLAAALFFFASLLLYCVCLGFLLHVWSILDAASWRPER
jgi:hypothetical protein